MAGKGLLDRLSHVPGVNVFVTPDEDVVTETSSPGSNNGNEATQRVPRPVVEIPPAPIFVSSVVVNSNVDPATRAKIEEIVSRADQVSYKKFADQLTGMRQVITDEGVAYKAALKASGYPISEVLSGVDVILDDLKKAEQDFKSAVPARIAAKVGERKKKIASLRLEVTTRQSRIAQLQAQIKTLQDEVAKYSQAEQAESSAMTQDERAVREDEERVMVAITAVKSVYTAERQRIEEHGKGV